MTRTRLDRVRAAVGIAKLALQQISEYDPVMYAVVLHHGYAWTQATEHAHGVDCGVPACGPCSPKRTAPGATTPTP